MHKRKDSRPEEKGVDSCVECGQCKAVCPSYIYSRDEKRSPRGRAIIIKEGLVPDSSFYDCTLCGACQEACFINVAIPLREQRIRLTAKGIETAAGIRMIENIRKYGNPFGNRIGVSDSDEGAKEKVE